MLLRGHSAACIPDVSRTPNSTSLRRDDARAQFGFSVVSERDLLCFSSRQQWATLGVRPATAYLHSLRLVFRTEQEFLRAFAAAGPGPLVVQTLEAIPTFGGVRLQLGIRARVLLYLYLCLSACALTGAGCSYYCWEMTRTTTKRRKRYRAYVTSYEFIAGIHSTWCPATVPDRDPRASGSAVRVGTLKS